MPGADAAVLGARRALRLCGTPAARRRPGWPPPSRRPSGWRRLCARTPLRDLETVEGPFPVFVHRRRALYGSWYEFFPRSEGATHRRSHRQGCQRDLPHRRQAARRGGRHGLRRDLPPAHPPDRGDLPQGQQQHPGPPTPDYVGSPWAIGSEHAATTRAPRPRHARGLRRVRRSRRGAGGSKVALDYALQAAPDHPWADSHPECSTTRADGTIVERREPAEEVPGHLPSSTSTATTPALTPGSARGCCVSGWTAECGSSGGQPAHEAGGLLGVAAGLRCARSDPDVDPPRRGVHQALPDAGPRDGRLPLSPTRTSRGATREAEWSRPTPSSPRDQRLHAAQPGS